MGPRRVHDPRLTDGSIVRSLSLIAIPIILSASLQSTYNMIGAFWVGRVGATAVAAVSVSMPILFMVMAAAFGFSVAGSTLVAFHAGAGDQRMVDYVAAQVIIIMTVTALFLSCVGLLLSPLLLRLMNVPAPVVPEARTYLTILFVAMPFSFTFLTMQSLLRGLGETRVPLYIVGGTVVLNFVLAPFLVLGMFGGPQLGVMGAAVATFIAQLLSAAAALWILVRGRHGIRLKRHNFRFDPKFLMRVAKLGYPSGIEQSTRSIGFIVLAGLVASFGTVVVAAYGVGLNVFNFAILPGLGLSMATAALVGQNLGANRIDRAEEIVRVSAMVSVVSLGTISAMIFAFAPALARLFVPGDEAVIANATYLLRALSLSIPAIGVQSVWVGVLRTSGRPKTAMYLVLAAVWLFQVPLTHLLGYMTAPTPMGVWAGLALGNILGCGLTWVVFTRTRWQQHKLHPQDRH